MKKYYINPANGKTYNSLHAARASVKDGLPFIIDPVMVLDNEKGTLIECTHDTEMMSVFLTIQIPMQFESEVNAIIKEFFKEDYIGGYKCTVDFSVDFDHMLIDKKPHTFVSIKIDHKNFPALNIGMLSEMLLNKMPTG